MIKQLICRQKPLNQAQCARISQQPQREEGVCFEFAKEEIRKCGANMRLMLHNGIKSYLKEHSYFFGAQWLDESSP